MASDNGAPRHGRRAGPHHQHHLYSYQRVPTASAASWDKLDYPNFALVVRRSAKAAYDLADSKTDPRWNPSNPKAKKYAEARAKGGS